MKSNELLEALNRIADALDSINSNLSDINMSIDSMDNVLDSCVYPTRGGKALCIMGSVESL